MMRAYLDACRERGEQVTYLWSTEDTIYDHFGYGIASHSARLIFRQPRLSKAVEVEIVHPVVYEAGKLHALQGGARLMPEKLHSFGPRLIDATQMREGRCNRRAGDVGAWCNCDGASPHSTL